MKTVESYLRSLSEQLEDLKPEQWNSHLKVQGVDVYVSRHNIHDRIDSVEVRSGHYGRKGVHRFTSIDVAHIAKNVRRIIAEHAADVAKRKVASARWEASLRRTAAVEAPLEQMMEAINEKSTLTLISKLSADEHIENGKASYTIDMSLQKLTVEQANAVLALLSQS